MYASNASTKKMIMNQPVEAKVQEQEQDWVSLGNIANKANWQTKLTM